MFIAISTYMIGTGEIKKEALRSHQLKFEQFSETMNKRLDQIALVMSRWSANSLYGNHLDRLVFIDNIDRMHEVMESPLVVGGSNVLIDEAHLFLNRQKAVITPDGIYYPNPERARVLCIASGSKGRPLPRLRPAGHGIVESDGDGFDYF
ncbi:hypothetical protein LJK88_46385 [Paenibacillus sp. P26]|nr:hypothetical protein LJK88_46385 [Paenibacillus sp. P26]